MIISFNQRKIKFELRIKLTHNTHCEPPWKLVHVQKSDIEIV